MLHKTRGIVFRFTKYGETSIIVNIFTELFGLQSYIVNSVRSKTGGSKIALYQPLTLLDLVVYHKDNAAIKRIKEIKCFHPFQSVMVEVKKSSIAMFINEILNKTVKEESHTHEVFEFIMNSIITLDAMEKDYENFHLIFMMKLSRYLGFGAHNLPEVLGGRLADIEIEKLLNRLIHMEYRENLLVTTIQRRVLLELLLKFYADHIDTLGEVKSVRVLKDVMN